VQLFVRRTSTMIHAAVEGDVDGIAEGSHAGSVLAMACVRHPPECRTPKLLPRARAVKSQDGISLARNS
jgi:hypothetical protein